MPRWKKLTADSMPAPFHFSNFEESVLARSAGGIEFLFASEAQQIEHVHEDEHEHDLI